LLYPYLAQQPAQLSSSPPRLRAVFLFLPHSGLVQLRVAAQPAHRSSLRSSLARCH
jgi:hypothetical protein